MGASGMFNNILAAVDGSACAASALDYALDLARKPGAKLTIIHAIDPTVAYLNEVQPGRSLGTDPLRDSGTAILKAAVEKATTAGLTPQTEMLEGKAVEEVVDAARRHKSDLIVIGSHGRTGLSRAFLGSVAEGVMREADVPTLVVHAR